MVVLVHLGIESGTGSVPVDGFIQIQTDDLGCIHKGEAQIFRHELGAEVFAAGDDFVLCVFVEMGVEVIQLLFNGLLQMQRLLDFREAGTDQFEHVGCIHVILPVGIQQVKQVGDLGIRRKPFSGSGNHHIASVRIRKDDVLHLAKLGCLGHTGAAKFCDF